MDKITIIKGSKVINFALGQIKYFLGDDFNVKNEIVKIIIKHFNKVDNSPYSIEEELTSSVLINDKKIDFKRIKLLEVNNHFNLNDDLKLRTKSLTLNLLETVFYDIEYNEEVNTLNILNASLAEYMTAELKETTESFEYAVDFDDLTIKTIIKNLNLKIIKNLNELNQYDLDYENNIGFQIDIVNKIASLNKNIDFLVIVEIPKLTKAIISKLNDFKNDNLKVIVLCPEAKVDSNIAIKNILSCNNQVIDLSNEVDLYNNVLLNLDKRLSIDELNTYLLNYFTQKELKIDLNLGEIL
ncbi:MAG: hypothetical protein RBS76_05280 [Acholeplasmatales bacterium]|jgi:hypothetical protein|nr:hypothetical protein [Acholeplasmataceae bacterium]MCK9233794.1 hypothetical protein [Acholeplasmataceae bacterium]MCK9289716.1 hypothetical protein [Acholeplasmataceae bacterium]MCK9428045.1 hypothetical protein [Acholeplasmataceae bacterium]MDY0115889.1 hypothetical protein [Acholeplasmatales bacterium]